MPRRRRMFDRRTRLSGAELRRAPALVFLLEFQRRRVDAVPLPRRSRSVREHVAEMRIALCAQDLGSPHPMRRVGLRPNIVLVGWHPETRPSRPRLVLLRRAEKLRSAAYAMVPSVLVIIPVPAAERPLGSLAARNGVL